MGRILSVKKYWGTGLSSEKTEVSQNLTKERKQPPVVILEEAILYIIFVLRLCQNIIGASDQDV